MSLSIFTNASSMASTSALNKSNSMLSTAMERLGTGKRINSAADDAAGLQIATRLQGQSNGMTVAKRNIADATAMLQTAEGAFDEVTNILYRMKDLATQSANDTNSTNDRKSIQSEFDQLNSELNNIMSNTTYGGDKLLQSVSGATTAVTGKLAAAVNFQIGASANEKLQIDVGGDLTTVASDLGALVTTSGGVGLVEDQASANSAITSIQTALDSVGTVRSSLGANINRLGHTSNNLVNIQDNTNLALGNIRDADFAAEASNMTRNQMLAQTGMSMLKQSNNMSGMVMSLLG